MGLLLGHLCALRTTIAGVAAFQTWVGAADATEAAACIHLFRGPPTSQTRFAVIGRGSPLAFNFDTVGTGVAAAQIQRAAYLGFVRLLEDGDAYGETLAVATESVVSACLIGIADARANGADTWFDSLSESDDPIMPQDDDDAGYYPLRVRKGAVSGGGYQFPFVLTFQTN